MTVVRRGFRGLALGPGGPIVPAFSLSRTLALLLDVTTAEVHGDSR